MVVYLKKSELKIERNYSMFSSIVQTVMTKNLHAVTLKGDIFDRFFICFHYAGFYLKIIFKKEENIATGTTEFY